MKTAFVRRPTFPPYVAVSEKKPRRKAKSPRARSEPEKPSKAEQQRRRKLEKFFNITVEEYETIFLHQKGKCALCAREPKNLRLAIDHDHKTGQIRGLLCMWCNKAIGFFRDDPEIVERIVAYFQSPPATQALGGARFGLKGRSTNKAATVKVLNRANKTNGRPNA